MSAAYQLLTRLYEVQIINAKEGEARIRALAARVRDPRARVWFTAAAIHFFNNIEQLDRPYSAPAQPIQKTTGVGLDNPLRPHKAPPAGTERLSPQAAAMLTSREGFHWPEPHPGEADAVDIGTTGTETGQPKTVWTSRKHKPTTRDERIQHAISQYEREEGRTHGAMESLRQRGEHFLRCFLEAGEPYETELHRPAWRAMRGREDAEDLESTIRKLAGGKGRYTLKKAPEGATVRAADTSAILSAEGRAALAAAGYTVDDEQPEPGTVHLSAVKPEFLPHDPERAPDPEDAMHLGPMAAADWPGVGAPSWAKLAGKTYQFNPLRASERQFWIRLRTLVDYLNYLHEELVFADSTNAADRNSAAKAQATLNRLGNKKGKQWIAVSPRDPNLFLDILAEAEAHAAAVPDIVQKHVMANTTTLLASDGPFRLYRINDIKIAQRIASSTSRWVSPEVAAMRGMYGETGQTVRWCIKNDNYVKSYFANGGPYYIITKNGDPFAMVQTGSPTGSSHYRTFQHVDNKAGTAAQAAEVARLVKRAGLAVRPGIEGDEGFNNLAKAVGNLDSSK